MADDTKNYHALLNGISKRIFYKESDITNDYLKSQIYPDMSDDDFNKLVLRLTNLLKVIHVFMRLLFLIVLTFIQ